MSQIALKLVREGAASESSAPHLESSESKVGCFVDSSGSMVGAENQDKCEILEKEREGNSDGACSAKAVEVDLGNEHNQSSDDKPNGFKVFFRH